MKAASVQTVARIMDAAIGEPPETPPGCVNLLLGCISWIAEGDRISRRTYVHSRYLFVSLMKFLTCPRRREERARLAEIMTTCRCRSPEAPLIVQRSPPRLHIHPYPYRTFHFLITCICDILSGGFGSHHRIETLYRADLHTHRAWPTCLKDLVPYSTKASLKMVAAWVYVYDDPTKSLSLGLVMKAIIMACRAEVVVELLASRSVWHWIELHAQNASHIPRFLFEPGDLGHIKRYLGVMQSVADVLQQIEHVMFGFELYLWCTENAKAHHKITSVVRVCDDVVRAVDAAEVFLRRRSSLDEGTRRTIHICRFLFSYVVATLHLIGTDKVSPMIGRLCPSVVAKIQEFARDDKHPFLRAVLHDFHTPWRQRCYGPDCLRTCASQNTEFMACGGCTRAVYCSRRCQKAAWKYDKAPHREVCRVYRHLHLTEKQAKENGARMDAMISVLVTALVDYLPPISLSERNFKAADAICRNFNRIAMAKFMHTMACASMNESGHRESE